MKLWHIAILSALLAVAAGVVRAYPPVPRGEMRQYVPAARAASEATLLFTGDIMLSRSVGAKMAALDDWQWPFTAIASTTRSADLAFGNLETTISKRGSANGCGYCFRADPRVVEGLSWAGFDVLSVANNHIGDYGPDAFVDTLQYLAASDISVAGGGRDLSEARAPIVRTVGNTRVAYLAYTNLLPASVCATDTKAGANCFDNERMRADIARAREAADVVAVSFHTGTEYEPQHNAFQERVYRAAIDAGANLVVGHHPHVVQDMEQYRAGWIIYSLGNFVFDQTFSEATVRGSMLEATVRDGAIRSVELVPVMLSRDYRVSPILR
ncbi:MAG: CapA family protein [Candidatus Yanofskybacteria bacterium]|nr:CapA family protein [Candidatus Yanofskybacteria bacterium]